MLGHESCIADVGEEAEVRVGREPDEIERGRGKIQRNHQRTFCREKYISSDTLTIGRKNALVLHRRANEYTSS